MVFFQGCRCPFFGRNIACRWIVFIKELFNLPVKLCPQIIQYARQSVVDIILCVKGFLP